MDVRELRIGNLVHEEILGEVTVVSLSSICQVSAMNLTTEGKREDVVYSLHWDNILPIPLTEEWLLKMNFKKIEESPFENIILPYWVNNTICCFYNETDKVNFLLGHAYTDFNGKYHVATAYWTNEVHTLQNYYKANTRKELEVK